MSISGAFSSLGINERLPGVQENAEIRKFPKNCSTVSLPNMVLSERPKFVRNVCDEERSNEQPVDFSKKYSESTQSDTCTTFNSVVKSYNSSFTMYAETDLDQPTDYSLRYAEDDSDSDRCNKTTKTETTEFVQDTVKTYCTEGTPYETPFNFSTSTSMSDLRIDDKTIDVNLDPATKKPTDLTSKVIAVIPNKIKSEFSSGVMSPEKPVNYCEEGTPGYFSRVASCGSLNSIPVNDPPKPVKEENLGAMKKELRRVNKFPAEAKAVKFEEVVNYAEETPLMFSRSSSLASLDSIEQHSIHDDRSSVVSDFSRLTSGIVSPSELPDSPSQTVPPSPKPEKTVIVFPTNPTKNTEEMPEIASNIVPKSGANLTNLTNGVVNSKETAKDERNPKNEDLNNLDLSDNSDDEDILAACINMGIQSISESNFSQKSEVANPSSTISLNNSQVVPKISPRKPLEPVENHPLRKDDVTSDSLRTYCTEGTPAVLSHAGSNSDLSILSMPLNENNGLRKESFQSNKVGIDNSKIVPENFQNGHEEAPALVTDDNLNNSPTGEAINNNFRRSSLSSLSVDSDESEEALLEECILAGMPKSSSPGKSSSVVTNPEVSADAENLNDTLVASDLSDEDDAKILENCIKIGIENNRYTQTKLIRTMPDGYREPSKSIRPKYSANNDVVSDTVKKYSTEHTPAILSHAGSSSNLSVLSTQENGHNFGLSDESDEDEDRLLDECFKLGMEAVAKNSWKSAKHEKTDRGNEKVAPNFCDNTASEDTASLSSFSDSSYEADQALLQQCIQAGMPKRVTRSTPEESSEWTPEEKALLQQCILDGMKKCRTATSGKPTEEESSELTEAEEALLRQCIVSGMPKNKNLAIGGPSGSRESTEITESDRLLLQRCILAGMPRSRSKTAKDSESGYNKQWSKKSREPEHTCCIHCPRNNRVRQSGHVKGRRKYKDRGVMGIRESRDVNIVYVTNQILTVKKEIVDRTHEKWV